MFSVSKVEKLSFGDLGLGLISVANRRIRAHGDIRGHFRDKVILKF